MDAAFRLPLTRLTLADWRRVLRRLTAEVATDRVFLVSAGCAFYATLALFPAISTVIALYGLIFDPKTVVPHLALLRDVVPLGAYGLIADRVHALVRQPHATLTVGLAVSSTITLFSAAAGTRSVLGAINLAYRARKPRPFLHGQAVALVLTLGVMMAAALCIALLVVLPAVLTLVGPTHGGRFLAREFSLVLLVLFIIGSVTMLYRIGPSRRPPEWRFVLPGVAVAAALWLTVSALFSWYVAHLGASSLTYGPLGAAVGLMMWFYVSAFAVLVGAELNAALEWVAEEWPGLSAPGGGGVPGV